MRSTSCCTVLENLLYSKNEHFGCSVVVCSIQIHLLLNRKLRQITVTTDVDSLMLSDVSEKH